MAKELSIHSRSQENKETRKVIVDDDIAQRIVGQRVFMSQRYPAIFLHGKVVRLHRFVTNAPTGALVVDHISGDVLDCRRSNLRICNRSVNARLKRKKPGARSKYRGVSWSKGFWQARIRVNGRVIHLGQFLDEVTAARSYDSALRLLTDDALCLNFPGDSIPAPMSPSLARVLGIGVEEMQHSRRMRSKDGWLQPFVVLIAA